LSEIDKKEPKVKIIDWNRNLFPELAESLALHGQIEDVLRDEDGLTVDGVKREIVLGRENVRYKVVPKGSATSNIHHLNRIQRKAVVNYKYKQLTAVCGSMGAKDIISKQYGVSIRTIERDLNPDVATFVAKPKKHQTNMYKDTKTWNPFVGCEFDCIYCEPSFKRQLKRQKNRCLNCYEYKLHKHPERLDNVPNERIIFVCGDSDISFAHPRYMTRVFNTMLNDDKKGRLWLLQSKDPSCFKRYLPALPKNTILLTTLETNRDAGYKEVSHAPPPSVRYEDFKNLDYPKKIVTVEPIMDFDLDVFVGWILSINPLAVFIGYNSHPDEVPLNEPDMEKTLDLIVALKNKGIRVLTKELRKMAYRDLYPRKN
jgi:hypothetical protein